jgi:hypothetical protein
MFGIIAGKKPRDVRVNKAKKKVKADLSDEAKDDLSKNSMRISADGPLLLLTDELLLAQRGIPGISCETRMKRKAEEKLSHDEAMKIPNDLITIRIGTLGILGDGSGESQNH